MRLSELIKDMEYQVLCGSTEVCVNNIYDDSRKVQEGDLFFCITGAVSDGHKYAQDVASKGAAVIVVEKEVEVPEGVTVIKVPCTRYAMGIISSRFYGEPSKELTVIGITGTKGKTTTTYMIREMLQAAGIKTGLIGTIEILDGVNSIPAANTTPESIRLHKYLRDMVNNGMKAVVMEVSSQGLMLDRVAGVDFDYGIFTNLSKDHIGPNEHKSFEEYMMWKAKLFTLCKNGIFNIDDPYAETMMKGADCRMITYGMTSDATYKASNMDLYAKDGVLGISYTISGKVKGNVVVDLPGEFSLHNSLAAVAIAYEMGVDFDDIRNILTTVKVRGRVEMVPVSNQFTVMIDYAHNAMSLESLFTALRAYKPARLISLFGCGGNRSKDRRYEMGEISGRMADFTIITSDNPRNENPQDIINDIKIGMAKTSGEYLEIQDRKEAIKEAIMMGRPGDIIVLAGKGHEDYQEIEGVKHHMDERELISQILEEEDVTKICGYNNRYFA
ncbi:MAG: UDP-N-acetylmuramoyl-L-alanyl-D-glutamate--2,6-diaminopimelate ligase [Lachnospiraceae bacterium]|nr:UDP-N-acetylmuramoyl-L-alanyl-D-glutamate--2,6-diaminopimelate ligase [Lachnospiraceae bacterium]